MTTFSNNTLGKLFIGGIPPNTTLETFRKYFELFGELCDCVLMQDKETGKSRGFGFITYKDSFVLNKVLSKQHIIGGVEVECKRAQAKNSQNTCNSPSKIPQIEETYKTNKLFVGGLTPTTSEEQFRNYFEQFGRIIDYAIMIDKETGKSRGFGFVTFDSEDAVDQVIQRSKENKIDGKWVDCKRAQPKGISSPNNDRYESRMYNNQRDRYQEDHHRYDRREEEHLIIPYPDIYDVQDPNNLAEYDPLEPFICNPFMHNPVNTVPICNPGHDYSYNPVNHYPNPFPIQNNTPSHLGYPHQYNPDYSQKTYDPSYAKMSNTSQIMPNSPVSTSTSEGSNSPLAEWNYSTNTGYSPATYGYNLSQDNYVEKGSSYRYDDYGGHRQSSSQMFGPMKGRNRREGIESRYYQPY